MGKKIHHMGMTIGKEEHDRFHKESAELTPEQHDRLMKKLGVSKEEDEEWHRTHLTLAQQSALRKQGLKAINPLVVSEAFLARCVSLGWLVQHGVHYFATPEGIRELRERFQIDV